ncbi:MAG: alanine dehydrogenase [Actinomycetota bacterium]
MESGHGRLTIGFPRMRKEPGERRDFLPPLLRKLIHHGAEIVVERGIGSGMGYRDPDYTGLDRRVHLGSHEEAYQQEVVVVLRCPNDDELGLVRSGAGLVSMLHFPTRPERVARLCRQGVEAIAMDCIVDDSGARLVEDSRSVAWNGLEAAFDALERTYPEFRDRDRPPIHVTVMGAGAIGRHAVEAATKYGKIDRAADLLSIGLPGVEVVTVGRNLTGDVRYMEERLRLTDVLVDATLRTDPSVPLMPNEWIELLPEHAVICDCVVDPYQLHTDPPTVRGIEGIPQGNLDGYVFPPDDPAWERTVPDGVPHDHRRTVVSCYSWPGVHPEVCMRLYGAQLAPLLETLVERGSASGLHEDGSFHERALARAHIRHWAPQPDPPGQRFQTAGRHAPVR